MAQIGFLRVCLSTAREIIAFVLFGPVFWFVAACVVKYAGPYLFNGSLWTPVVLVGTIVIAYPLILLCQLIGNLQRIQVLPLTGLCVAVATWLDCIGIMFFQDALYGSDPLIVARGAAWILWGVGFLTFAALWVHSAEVGGILRVCLSNPREIIAFIIFGPGFWLVAALAVKYLGPYIFNGSFWGPLVLVFTIAVTWLVAKGMQLIGKIERSQVSPMVALCGSVATSLDCVGIFFFQDALYGSDPLIVARGAAWVLWGAGWLTFIGLWIHCQDLVQNKSYGQL